ncbi:pentapeptide repeat-containing protein [Nonomuraea sp. K274]|uniref:Pentapeptide repeat-containing protein n=1 Tax=Nonomuraea cypriaca TaxID=1187855 RepID=A0A931A804_9ACTN|nr:pentapeptide repeat-containing protein [Nonomuraea cypriaca]
MGVCSGIRPGVGLPGADLRGSAFHGTRLREADLTGARLEGAELRRADLSGAWLHGADLTKCDLRGSDLSTLDPHTVTLKDAIIDPFQATVVAAALGLIVRE